MINWRHYSAHNSAVDLTALEKSCNLIHNCSKYLTTAALCSQGYKRATLLALYLLVKGLVRYGLGVSQSGLISGVTKIWGFCLTCRLGQQPECFM